VWRQEAAMGDDANKDDVAKLVDAILKKKVSTRSKLMF
jgi:hypothetical protein